MATVFGCPMNEDYFTVMAMSIPVGNNFDKKNTARPKAGSGGILRCLLYGYDLSHRAKKSQKSLT
jgi:hypothetical protein